MICLWIISVFCWLTSTLMDWMPRAGGGCPQLPWSASWWLQQGGCPWGFRLSWSVSRWLQQPGFFLFLSCWNLNLMAMEYGLSSSFSDDAFAVVKVEHALRCCWSNAERKREWSGILQPEGGNACMHGHSRDFVIFHRDLELINEERRVCCKYYLVKIDPHPGVTSVRLLGCYWWKLILTSKISQALLVMMITLELGTECPKCIQILASVNSPNVGRLKLFHVETMWPYLPLQGKLLRYLVRLLLLLLF